MTDHLEDGLEEYTAGPLERRVPAVERRVLVLERRVPLDLAGLRLDQALARMFPEHSRSRLAEWLRAGLIQVEKTAARPRQPVCGGERVVLQLPEAPDAAPAGEAMDLAVVHEDAAVMVIDKPVGLVVHPGSGNRSGTLLNALLHHDPALAEVPRAGIVHRLDKDTSGLLVVARTLTAQTDLVRQLQARTVKREYLALAHGQVPGDGVVDAPIGRDPRNRLRMGVVGAGKPARTHYRVLERFARATLLECTLDTGRTHQIRVHMQSLGHPLVGDALYRAGRARVPGPVGDFPRQALHAARLGFIHPESGQPVQFESPLPADFAALLEQLRGGA